MSKKSKLKACEPVSVMRNGMQTMLDMRDWPAPMNVENGEMENGEMGRSGGEKPDERQAVLGI